MIVRLGMQVTVRDSSIDMLAIAFSHGMAFSDLTLSKAHGRGHKQMPDSRQKTSRGICACGKWHGSMKQLWMNVKLIMWSFCSFSEGFGFHFASMCIFSV